MITVPIRTIVPKPNIYCGGDNLISKLSSKFQPQLCRS